MANEVQEKARNILGLLNELEQDPGSSEKALALLSELRGMLSDVNDHLGIIEEKIKEKGMPDFPPPSGLVASIRKTIMQIASDD